MSPLLLAPAGLAALAALVVPLLVHLARRPESRPVDFAALRWLRPKPRPRRRPRFDEHLLLAVRLLLVALLALWIARPALRDDSAPTPLVAVWPGISPARAAALVTKGTRNVWLAPGFAALSSSPPTASPPIASVIRELDAQTPAKAAMTIVVPTVIAADGARLHLGHHVIWKIVPGAMAAPVARVRPAVSLAIRATPGTAGLGYIQAAAAALASPGRAVDLAPTSAPLPRGNVLAWWAPGQLPNAVSDWIARGGMALLPANAVAPAGPTTTVWRDQVGAPLADATIVGRGRAVRFTRPLNPAAMPALLDPTFPDRLAAALRPAIADPIMVGASDYVPDAGAAVPAADLAPRDLQPLLAIGIALLFLIERWFATRSRRAVTP